MSQWTGKAIGGLVGLVALGRLMVVRTDKKLILAAAVLISLLGLAAGVMISRFWWLQKPLTDFEFVTKYLQ